MKPGSKKRQYYAVYSGLVLKAVKAINHRAAAHLALVELRDDFAGDPPNGCIAPLVSVVCEGGKDSDVVLVPTEEVLPVPFFKV